MKSLIFPSDYWPNCLKLALSSGTTEEAPLSVAINDFMTKISLMAGAEVLKTDPKLLPIENAREILGGMGFRCESLNTNEVWALYDRKEKLLSSWGQPHALLELCKIYLGEAALIRGHDFKKERLRSGLRLTKIRLSDIHDQRSVLCFVLKEKIRDQGRLDEFRSTALGLCPEGYEILIKFPKRKTRVKIKELTRVAKIGLYPRRIG